ncbi:hypothetical protein BLA9940_05937 [Burkholderia aenigmatica]|uniref:hypothetical protein n=1 Tax=Burkholderia cepacia complex TaxID=87882 RepID=UPI000F093D20|nr:MULTISPECIES: hypothetical protein [Burkholderia cepacia complex]AYQ37631.1 hypothetical protein CVS37_05530 [Burkholderia lata]VWC98052.1 hypothetical protein BLA9940_05937 [Burkholderia aenigmatica]
MIPRNLKHVGPYVDRVNKRSPANNSAKMPLPDDCKGSPVDRESGAPYWPWGPRINPEQLATILRELLTAVDELAKLEHWRDSDYDHVVMCIERQPISTLLPDLGYFRDRLQIARAEVQAQHAATARSRKSI